MGESLKETERLSVDAELLRQQCEELKQENAMLRAQMQQHGIVVPDLTGATSWWNAQLKQQSLYKEKLCDFI